MKYTTRSALAAASTFNNEHSAASAGIEVAAKSTATARVSRGRMRAIRLAEGTRRRHAAALLAWVLLVAAAEDDGAAYRSPSGSVAIDGGFGVGAGGGATRFLFDLGAGYAVLTGVVPGVRGALAVGPELGGALAATLTLSLPIETYVVPYVVGELGGQLDGDGLGWTWGAGGGLFVGDPGFAFSIRIGWMFRRVEFGRTSRSTTGPILGVTAAL